MNKKILSERDICTKFITPNIVSAGWDVDTQVREEVGFTDGRIYVRGKIHARGAKKRVDYILYYKPNIPLAIIELKPVSYVLGLTNLILHGLDVPDWHYLDSLKTEYNSIGPRQQVDCILANPPFGASIADGVETNFPQSFRCRESADLFVILMIQLLKPGGRCAIVLPDGCITGDGYKERIREKLLTDCNLHTIVRLPQSTFFPATVSTNLLFFQKGTPTKEIWYWEHRLPEGQKSYSKTKAIQFDEFAPLIEWWDKREESEVAWKVKVGDLKRGFDLDVKNPTSTVEEREMSVDDCLKEFRKSLERVGKALAAVEKEYAN